MPFWVSPSNIVLGCYLIVVLLEDVRQNFHLIEKEIKEYMARYEVRLVPSFLLCVDRSNQETASVHEIRALVARLVQWFSAWAPPEE